MNNRIEKVQNIARQLQVDFLLFEDEVSLFYLTGMHFSQGKLIVGHGKVCLFVDSRYSEAAKEKGLFEVADNNAGAVTKFLSDLVPEGGKVAVDGKSVTHSNFLRLQKELAKMELIGHDDLLKEMRIIKDPEEIASMKKAAALSWRGFHYICSLLKEGITEEWLAMEYEVFCRHAGAEKLAFDPIVCFGKNGARPHHRPGSTALQINQSVLIDVGVVCDGYHSDMTRVIFFGEADFLLEEYYEVVKKAHARALSLCRPGTALGDLDRAAREVFLAYGYEENFIHALGHGIGLETHELFSVSAKGADSDLQLKPGMTLTIEPGLYKTGLGGVRYEDTIVITHDGYENFYSAH